MKNTVCIFLLLLISASSYSQQGMSKLFFKNGDTVTGLGKLKGADLISLKRKKGYPFQDISFKELHKAEMKIKDTVITYKLYPIFKKNGKKKKSSVIGLFKKGKVNLYVKGDFKNLVYMNLGGGLSTTSSPVHYFLRKENDEGAVHLGSSFITIEPLLKKTESIFSDYPGLVKEILSESRYEISIFELIDKYNQGCN